MTRTDGTTYEVDADPFGLSRPLDSRLRTPGAPQGLALGLHTYDGAGNLTARGGEVYEYDQVSRLTRYRLGDGSFQTYAFDKYGNLTEVHTKTATSDQTRSLATATATSRLSSATYDPRGNLTSWGDETYSWDALNMLKAHSYPARTYLYTADNERVAELHYGGPGQARWVWSLRDLDGKTLRLWESDAGTWTWEKDYIYRGGELLAAETSEPSPRDRQFFAPDHLGTPRLITDRNGTIIELHHLFGFGEELAPPTAERKRFTGHDRDWNDGGRSDDLDYMHARYCSPHLGRFLSVDPILGDVKSPSSWNRFSYARNRPLTYVDLTGETVSLAGLSARERALFLESLNGATGNAYDVDGDGNLQLLEEGKNASVTGSYIVGELIQSPHVFSVVSCRGCSVAFATADLETRQLSIDFADFAAIEYGEVNPRAFNIGMNFLHEGVHLLSPMLTDPLARQGGTGPVVDAINLVRKERGLPLRSEYNGRRSFDKTEIFFGPERAFKKRSSIVYSYRAVHYQQQEP